MSITIGIVGAGLIGRLLALECLQQGWQVTLFDQDNHQGKKSCGWVAAGMVAPYTEFESSEPLLLRLGLETIPIWPKLVKHLDEQVSYQFSGTLLVCHPQDTPELTRFQTILQDKIASLLAKNCQNSIMTRFSREQLECYAPDLSSVFQQAYWLADEGHIDSTEFFKASTAYFQANQVTWHENMNVSALAAHEITSQNKKYYFDIVCDTRGLGAKTDWQGLRGVRGELVWLHAPTVKFTCPVRLLHPRYPIYISPRADHLYIVGATSIESDDMSPISVQSTLELLSAAYTLHSGFAEARVINTLTQARPCFPDQQPKINYAEGLIRINGLYRHGYMVGPAVVQDAIRLLKNGKKSMKFPELLDEEPLVCK